MRVLILSALALAACSPSQPVAAGNDADVAAAAERARGNIAGYGANEAAPVDETVPLTPPAPGQPGGLADDRTPIAEGPFAPDSAQGAANVVQTYYALIGEKAYAKAWALWGAKGADSGQSADAFAASFGKYSEYHANVGAPGRVDSGAGQRYVTVPVQPYARLTDGKAVYWIGSVTLHRTADIDGATAEQKSWRIKSIDLKPAPAGKAS